MVFANDAEDIKKHPFFANIHWSTIHAARPPFVPKVPSGQPITKYFDDEGEIMSASDHFDSSSCGSSCADGDCDKNAGDGAGDGRQARNVNNSGKGRKRKEKKRPRDKLLRDPQVGRTVLELRKKGKHFAALLHCMAHKRAGAFVGYTYRRPRFTIAGGGAGGSLGLACDSAKSRGVVCY